MLNRTLAAVLAFWAISVLAQGIRATLVGRVTDESGAIVPHAKITVVNSGTNETRTLIASDSGEFTFAQLPPGDYTLTNESSGFYKDVRHGILLETGQEGRMDVVLKVGSVVNEVQVDAAVRP